MKPTERETCMICGEPLSDHAHDPASNSFYCRGARKAPAPATPPRVPVDQMPGLLRQVSPRAPLGVYVHAKSGAHYVLVGGTFLATGEGQEVYLQYVSRDHGYSAHRTVEDFFAEVEVGGKKVQRFSLAFRMDQDEVLMMLIKILVRNTGELSWPPSPSPSETGGPGGSADA